MGGEEGQGWSRECDGWWERKVAKDSSDVSGWQSCYRHDSAVRGIMSWDRQDITSCRRWGGGKTT